MGIGGRTWLIGGALAISSLACGQLTEREITGLEESLFLGNLSLKDLATDRNPFRTMPLSDWIQAGLGDPINASSSLMQAHESGLTLKVSDLIKNHLKSATGIDAKFPNDGEKFAAKSGLPEPLGKIVDSLVGTISQADLEIRTALEKLKPEELRLLIESLPSHAIEEPRIKLGFVRGRVASLVECEALMKKVDLGAIMTAGWKVQVEVEEAAAALKAAKITFPQKRRLVVNGLVVVIGSSGDDAHDELDARVTIDLGGDDTYTGRAGAGVGYSSVLIDVSGNDRYNVPDISVGVGVLGVGCAVDIGGNDQFWGQSLNFGCGIGGLGVFSKSGGEDYYSSVAAGQGFGMFGAGICTDSGGNDLYKISLMGQGAGRLNGLGWLIDAKGADIYQAGGLILNSPLFADVNYSFAQGFGMGFREDSGGSPGGCGLLTDGAGRDNYLAETYAQAASYWFAVGSLYDKSGHDTYKGHHYVQSSAMHMTSAYLFDLAGEDSYTTQYGAAHAIGHDYGLAFLLDRAGNDVYASRDSRPATGIANGVGIFLEGDGIDRYSTWPAFARRDRSMISLSVFADLGGADLFPEARGEGEFEYIDVMSIRDDQVPSGAAAGSGTTPAQTVPDPAPGSKPKPSDAELDRLYKLASQWGVGSATASVNDAIRDLIAIGVPAYEWMIEKKLAAVQRLEVRAWARITNGIGGDAVAALGRKALSANEAELGAIIRIGIEGRITDIGALLPNVITTKPNLRGLAIRAAGSLKAIAASESIMPIMFTADPVLKRAAMAALADIGDPNSVGTAASFLNSDDPFIRDSAVRLILQVPQQAESIGRTLIEDVDERKARTGLLILAKLDMYNSLQRVAAAFDDPRPGMRISALLLLNGKCPPESKNKMIALQNDPLPSVARVAKQVKP